MAQKWDEKSTGGKIAFIMWCLVAMFFSVVSPILALPIIGIIVYRNFRTPKSN